MRVVIHILLRDLRGRVRDRSAVAMGLVAPLALIVILSLLAGGTASPNRPLGYVPGGSSPVDQALTGVVFPTVESAEVAQITAFTNRADADRALDDGTVDALIVTRNGDLTVIRTSAAPVGGSIAESIATATAAQINAATTFMQAAGVLRPEVTQSPATAIAQVAAAPARVAMADQDSAAGGLSVKTQIAAGMATFFLFFTVQFGLLGLLQERREGTLARLLAAPVTPAQVLVAKLLVSFVLGVTSMSVLIVAAALLLDATFGSVAGVGILIVSGVAAATSTVALVVGIARTPEQAGLAQSMIALVLGILGGSFFSMARAGGFGAVATTFTPHYWFNEGLAQLSGGDGWTAALGPAGVLAVFTVLVGLPGVILARRSVRP